MRQLLKVVVVGLASLGIAGPAVAEAVQNHPAQQQATPLSANIQLAELSAGERAERRRLRAEKREERQARKKARQERRAARDARLTPAERQARNERRQARKAKNAKLTPQERQARRERRQARKAENARLTPQERQARRERRQARKAENARLTPEERQARRERREARRLRRQQRQRGGNEAIDARAGGSASERSLASNSGVPAARAAVPTGAGAGRRRWPRTTRAETPTCRVRNAASVVPSAARRARPNSRTSRVDRTGKTARR
ncbi:MAG: hypothetical protein AcusKO_13230 [Acuticoccus sp.]